MALLAMILSIFKEKNMRTHRETKKSYYAKLQANQVCQTRKKSKNISLLKFDSEEFHSTTISSGFESISTDDQLSLEKFDKAAHAAMLEMLSIDASYYYQVSISIELK